MITMRVVGCRPSPQPLATSTRRITPSSARPSPCISASLASTVKSPILSAHPRGGPGHLGEDTRSARGYALAERSRSIAARPAVYEYMQGRRGCGGV